MENLKKTINHYLASEKYKTIVTARDYYENRQDIKKKKRPRKYERGVETEERMLSDTRLSHPFFAKLVRQKINYIFGKPFSFDTKNVELARRLAAIFDHAFMRTLRKLATQAILSGCGWLLAGYDEKGKLKFDCIPSVEIIPLHADSGELSGVIRVYETFNPMLDDKPVKRVETYTKNERKIFTMSDSGELTETGSEGHFKVRLGKEKRNADFGRVPFIPFRYNPEEISLLTYIKDLIDEYDALTSDVSNNIKDTPDSVKIIRGHRDDPGETVRNLASYRLIFVEEGGGVEQLLTPLDTQACESQLTRLRKDLYDAACCVDAQEAATGNTSGVAIRLRYADLDMDCQAMASEFAAGLEEMIDFVSRDAGENFDASEVEFIFNTDVAINENETIAACMQSQGLISERTIIANHPWIKNIDEETEQIEAEKGEYSRIGGDEQ